MRELFLELGNSLVAGALGDCTTTVRKLAFLPLTLALSLRERRIVSRAGACLDALGLPDSGTTLLPLPEGEGRVRGSGAFVRG